MTMTRSARMAARLFRRFRYPVVRQYDIMDCGPAALLSVLRYHGGDASLVQVREAAATDATGASLLTLSNAAQSLGFTARGVSGTYEQLREAKLPCIAHVVLETGLQHFVVVYEANAGKVVVGDPATGLRDMPRAEFEVIWKSHAALLLEPGTALTSAPPEHWLRWLSRHFETEVTWVTQSVFLGAVATVLGLATAVGIQLLIDRLIPRHDLRMIKLVGATLVAVQVARALVSYWRQRFLLELNRRVSLAISEEFMARLLRLPTRFFESRKRGDVMARMADAARIQSAVMRVLGSSVADVLILAGSLAALPLFAPRIALVAIAAAPLYALVLVLLARRMSRDYTEVMSQSAQVESGYIDTLDGVEEIRAYGSADVFTKLNVSRQSLLQSGVRRLGLTQARMGLVAELTGGLLITVTLAVSALAAASGRLAVGEMMGAYSLLASIIPAVGRLVDGYVAYQGAAVAARRLRDLLLSPAEASPVEPRPMVLRESLSIAKGSFAWPKGQPQLRHIDLKVRLGEITGLCGTSGSGKSTLVKILQRRYALSSGQLLVDDTSAADIHLDEYRAQVALLTDNAKIFNASLAENIAAGRPGITGESIMRRIEALGLVPFYERFPGGLATRLGEDHRRLSSGERQVVAATRALLCAPALFIVDEGINGIDAACSALLLDAFRRHAAGGNAVLLISHDMRLLAHTDRTYVLDRGAISELQPPAMPHRGAELFVNARRIPSTNLPLIGAAS
jgi:ATP-binding cassette subfamily B protein